MSEIDEQVQEVESTITRLRELKQKHGADDAALNKEIRKIYGESNTYAGIMIEQKKTYRNYWQLMSIKILVVTH